jgi:hypothetical protein
VLTIMCGCCARLLVFDRGARIVLFCTSIRTEPAIVMLQCEHDYFLLALSFSLPFILYIIVALYRRFSLVRFLFALWCVEHFPFTLLLRRRGLPIDVVTCGWSVVASVFSIDGCVRGLVFIHWDLLAYRTLPNFVIECVLSILSPSFQITIFWEL